ncbi:MAG: FecR domain-containing protein [Planctomycetes bacterium]|nr:FecR domain-containing protein [Planctomycetota bacterium]
MTGTKMITGKKSAMFACILALVMICGPLTAATFKVVNVKGDVKFRAPGKLKIETVKVGDELDAGGKVRLEEGALLRFNTPMGDAITLKDKAYLSLSSLIESKEKSTVNLQVYSGVIQCQVNKLKGDSSFSIQTPAAVVGVRGTSFTCSVQPDLSTVVGVSSGLVAMMPVAAGGGGRSVLVDKTKAAVVKASGAVFVVQVKQTESPSSSSGEKSSNEKAGEKGETVNLGEMSEKEMNEIGAGMDGLIDQVLEQMDLEKPDFELEELDDASELGEVNEEIRESISDVLQELRDESEVEEILKELGSIKVEINDEN